MVKFNVYGGEVELKSGFVCEDGEQGFVCEVIEPVTVKNENGEPITYTSGDIFVPDEDVPEVAQREYFGMSR